MAVSVPSARSFPYPLLPRIVWLKVLELSGLRQLPGHVLVLGDKITCIPEDEKQIELYDNGDIESLSTKMHILIHHNYVAQFRTGYAKHEEDAHSGCEGPTAAISGAGDGGGGPEVCDGTSRMTISFA
jgi:hypothetical protein